ncbi:DNA ligase 3-like [Dendronephthya gigantea]|uniref:DNA ligase 3-like n=1 Tax=Dendronephthya gigantea TaxID=151771 RepID=UPI00106B4881|nr:DNA ligase 3-like [Dendronephthya gigantea]
MLRIVSISRFRYYFKTKLFLKYSCQIFTMGEPQFFAEYAKQGRAKCKNCKEKIDKSCLRIGKLVPNHFSDDGGMMKEWYHTKCIFDKFSRARSTTKRIDSTDELDGFTDLVDDDKKSIRQYIADLDELRKQSPQSKKKKQTQLPFASKPGTSSQKDVKKQSEGSSKEIESPEKPIKSTSFYNFCQLCSKLFDEPSYNAKTSIVKMFLNKVRDDDQDVYLVVKLLLPGAVKRIYNLQNKQLVKLFSQIFDCSLEEMIADLNQGDVSETVKKFFEESHDKTPSKKSTLTLQEVDNFLDKMSTLTREDEQQNELTKITKRCTSNDLKYVIRLIKHDLKINAGAKHVLEALDPNAYAAFHASHNLQDVVERCLKRKDGPGLTRNLSIKTRVMTPVKPMLAEACKSFASAMKKCPKGMFAEIKYDGERVQVHKSGNDFQFFSRSLKPVIPHKVAEIKEYLPKACPHGNDLILDSEVLLVDHKTGKPLPFGTLGIHKKSSFKDASVCLFIFDCLQFNDKNLMQKPMEERRKLLERNVKEIKNHIMLSETKLIQNKAALSDLMMKAIDEGLEGLVMKDLKSIYEPGKRHWLKMKKDYLEEGSMADTADLVVLGAYYGTGSKGGMMSVFLMGTYNKFTKKWCTVAKCGNGHDDKTLEKINKELQVVKISKESSKVPLWLNVHKTLLPDFVVEDPKAAPVWEITGAEFSKSTTHTADGISIRFPRVTKVREDKDWATATNLQELKKLVAASKETSEMKTVSSTSTVKDDDVMETTEEPETSGEFGDDERCRGQKRKSEGTDDGATSSKKAKPMCMYGSKCYQKSRKHRETYIHDEASEDEERKDDVTLPSIFHGTKIFIEDDVKDTRKLKRYIVAYDGLMMCEYERSQATHIVSEKTGQETPAQFWVKPSWIWESIKAAKMLSEDEFKP